MGLSACIEPALLSSSERCFAGIYRPQLQEASSLAKRSSAGIRDTVVSTHVPNNFRTTGLNSCKTCVKFAASLIRAHVQWPVQFVTRRGREFIQSVHHPTSRQVVFARRGWRNLLLQCAG